MCIVMCGFALDCIQEFVLYKTHVLLCIRYNYCNTYQTYNINKAYLNLNLNLINIRCTLCTIKNATQKYQVKYKLNLFVFIKNIW